MARFDYVGFALLALGVGALQVALDKGQEDDWFGSRFITTLIILAIVGLVSLVIWEWRHKEPIVDVHLFKGFNFASCNLMMFVLGAVLFSSTVLLPQFLQTLMGYTAQKAGMVISMAAILLVFLLPLVGRLAGHFQARHLLAFGWIALAVAMYFSCKHIDLLISFRSAAWMRIWQYLPVGFFVRSAHDGCLCRPAGVEKQRCRRFDQLHAQYRAERRNLGCDYVACTPKSVPSIRSRRVHTLSSVRCSRRRLDEPSDACRSQHALGSTTSNGQNVQLGDHTGSSLVLRRNLLAARLDFRADVFIVLPASQKRTGQRRPGRRSLKIALEQWL
jgi:hypothetical protein